jgi:hypothetical protein
MKNAKKLGLLVSLLSLASAAIWLTGCDDHGGGGGAVGTNAPASIAGTRISHTITTGSDPFPASGTFVLAADASGAYTITGVTNSSGTYIYTPDTNGNTATLELDNDTAFGTVTEQLLFDNSRSGSFSATSGAGAMSGKFSIH